MQVPRCCGVCFFDGYKSCAKKLGPEAISELPGNFSRWFGFDFYAFTPERFYEQIKGRTLWIVGDSQVCQCRKQSVLWLGSLFGVGPSPFFCMGVAVAPCLHRSLLLSLQPLPFWLQLRQRNARLALGGGHQGDVLTPFHCWPTQSRYFYYAVECFVRDLAITPLVRSNVSADPEVVRALYNYKSKPDKRNRTKDSSPCCLNMPENTRVCTVRCGRFGV
jgi:hypothetical protein